MQKLAKILFIALLLTFLPLKQWGQTPYRQYADNGILLDSQTFMRHSMLSTMTLITVLGCWTKGMFLLVFRNGKVALLQPISNQ